MLNNTKIPSLSFCRLNVNIKLNLFTDHPTFLIVQVGIICLYINPFTPKSAKFKTEEKFLNCAKSRQKQTTPLENDIG